jgi:hypothetical protein
MQDAASAASPARNLWQLSDAEVADTRRATTRTGLVQRVPNNTIPASSPLLLVMRARTRVCRVCGELMDRLMCPTCVCKTQKRRVRR